MVIFILYEVNYFIKPERTVVEISKNSVLFSNCIKRLKVL